MRGGLRRERAMTLMASQELLTKCLFQANQAVNALSAEAVEAAAVGGGHRDSDHPIHRRVGQAWLLWPGIRQQLQARSEVCRGPRRQAPGWAVQKTVQLREDP